MIKLSWSYDEIILQLRLNWGVVGDDRLVMRAGWKWYAEGMEPLTIVVYDHQVTSVISGERRTERRLVTVQGFKMISDYILDYMEGW